MTDTKVTGEKIKLSYKKEIGDSYKNDIEGFWLRTGTIQYVNGVPVDTIKFADTEDNKNYRQIKSYSKGGHVVWLNNWADTINNPWSGGMGGYGTVSYTHLTLPTNREV